jgi:hypothetical protein
MTTYEILQVIFTAFLLAAAIIGACIYGAQLIEMQKATVAATKAAKATEDAVIMARDNARLDQRAWVTVAGITGFPEVGKPLRITIYFANTGKTPAKKVKITPLIGPYKGDIVPDFPAEVTKIASGDIVGQGSVPSTVLLAPNAQSHATINLSKTNLAPEAVTELRERKYRFLCTER